MPVFEPVFSRIFKTGRLTVIDANGRNHEFGDGNEPHSTMRLHDRRIHWKLLVNPHLYVGEGYMDGAITFEDGTLYDFLDLLGRNASTLYRERGDPISRWLAAAARRTQQHNSIGRARSNVAHHYDLTGKLYDLFLDRDRQYSCAYFASGNDTLDVAQDKKKSHIAAKLLLEPGQSVLDIGSGWGGLALYLAEALGADVTGLTLSVEQHTVANRRARKKKLDNQVRFHLRDYREETGAYDRIVSVGMFEHVGARHYKDFFAKVRELLSDDGVFLLHSIGRMEPPGTTNPWLRKYIFPGGYAPALSETIAAIERAGLWITDIEILRRHYAETLHEWNRRFQQNRDKIKEIYDERFCRMWEFYLQVCEIGFRYLQQMVFQIQIAKRQDVVPTTRDYIDDWKREQTGAGSMAN